MGTFVARSVDDGPLGVEGRFLDVPGFAVVRGGASHLQPGESTSWEVVFQPDIAGAFSGTGAVVSDDPDEVSVPGTVTRASP